MNLSCGAGFVQLLMLLSGVSGIAIIFREQSRASLLRHNKTKIAAVGQRIMQEASNLKIKEQLRFLHRRGTLRKEISQGTAFLRNRIAASDQKRITAEQMLTELMDQCRMLKLPYARMLSLIRMGEGSHAVREFVTMTGDPHAREYAGMIVLLDELLPQQIYEDLTSFQRQLMQERITVIRRKDEALSNLLYIPVMANLILIFFDFLYVAYFLQQREMMGLLMG